MRQFQRGYAPWSAWPFWKRLLIIIIGLPLLIAIGKVLVRFGERMILSLDQFISGWASDIINLNFNSPGDVLQLCITLLIAIGVLVFLLGPRR